ncbi:MAG: SUMF1/EgtB/PvdO family nonheme iron enzyme [Deltaproteobacteria bacterium]|nr:SUMF1/EgtB/PvdO family nonheme iron enzyme [Deltaproteobacteria bacterium]
MKNRLLIAVICFTALMFLTSTAFAAEKRRVEVKAKSASQSAEHRIALVIGNANYRIGALRNAANDARAIAAALRELDFEVDEQINLSYQEMGRAVNRFGQGIRKDSVALFYYAGHGLQVQGSNYLVPVDMEIQNEGEVQSNTVNAGQVLAKMGEAKNPVNIVILDACRDNPYVRGFKRSSGNRGLAPMNAPVGSFVAYAATPGKTAGDGKGKNSLYTESLIRQIRTPGMKIEDVFKRVRTEVRSKSKGGQVPSERSSLEGDFYFARGSMVAKGTPAPSAVKETASGMLTVKSNVSGAKVYINGAYEGDTPHTATLKPGAYAIILKKAGYPDAAEEGVRVEAGGANTISIVMEKPAPPSAEARTFTSPTLGATFALIPAGTFTMGSPAGEPGRYDNETQHQVTISRPFYLQTTEVTQGQWQQVMGNNPSYFKKCGADCPVEKVSWNDVQEFIRKLNSMEGTDKYRLPTEAQWEYAARAGTQTPFSTGVCLATGEANYNGNYPLEGCTKGEYRQKTMRGGSFAPNAWGLYDMHGNVLEWVHDWYGNYPSGSVTDPEGPSSGSGRVGRGGSWFYSARNIRSAYRDRDFPGYSYSFLGFRLLRTR